MDSISDRQELVMVAHGRKSARAFCRRAGIDSVRNLEIYLKKSGVWDGHEWTYGELSKAFGFSRPRAFQICQATEKHLKVFYSVAP